MTKGVKITLWVVGALVTLFVALFLSADIIASRFVKKEVAKTFVNMPGAEASIGGVYLDLLSGSAIVKDIAFSTPNLAVKVPTLEVWNIRYLELIKERRVVIWKVSVDDAVLRVNLDEKNPAALLPEFPKDTTLEKAPLWLQSIEIQSFDIERFCAQLQSVHTPLRVEIDTFSLATQDWKYSFADSVLQYNDSCYELDLRALRMKTPDGLFALELHDLEQEDQGALSLGYTHFINTIDPKLLADRKKEPTAWIEMELNRLSTSAFNPLRKVMAKDYTLDRLQVDVKRLHVHQDNRYPPKVPYSTPQDFLRKLPVSFCVNRIKATVRKADIELATTETNCGELHAHNIHADLANITNRRGATWYNHAKAPFGEKGQVEASYTIHMDKKASFEIQMNVQDVETEDLNGFIRPLIGITSQCHIDQLETHYKGDRNSVRGEFCMQYHGLDVRVHKEDKIPYEIVTKNADVFTNLANTLVPKSNPTTVDPAPRRYYVEWKRDEWKPYPLYLFGPCIDGVKKTMLPGLYVHKQVKGSGS